MKNTHKGFTLIELLVVVGIIGILATITIASLNGARAKARDAKRISDIKQMSTILETELAANPNGTAVTGCDGQDNITFATGAAKNCTGPGDVAEFAKFRDPLKKSTDAAGTACKSGGAAACEYAISLITNGAAAAAATTANYQLCFWLEQGSNGLPGAAVSSISSGGTFVAGCK